QGSEWKVVIVMIDDYPGARMICTREFWYTAISRAKELCVLIGRKGVADQGCRRVAIRNRKTFLRELILREQARRELAEL
ncbi:MAG TPA: ATP-binding domain-containing protein, partial [Candidatus Binatia bacterium]|nr:ATP-binding domain-containing protein [Candidatus Binatia bacterium]